MMFNELVRPSLVSEVPKIGFCLQGRWYGESDIYSYESYQAKQQSSSAKMQLWAQATPSFKKNLKNRLSFNPSPSGKPMFPV
jgi:hypothetical protein